MPICIFFSLILSLFRALRFGAFTVFQAISTDRFFSTIQTSIPPPVGESGERASLPFPISHYLTHMPVVWALRLPGQVFSKVLAVRPGAHPITVRLEHPAEYRGTCRSRLGIFLERTISLSTF